MPSTLIATSLPLSAPTFLSRHGGDRDDAHAAVSRASPDFAEVMQDPARPSPEVDSIAQEPAALAQPPGDAKHEEDADRDVPDMPDAVPDPLGGIIGRQGVAPVPAVLPAPSGSDLPELRSGEPLSDAPAPDGTLGASSEPDDPDMPMTSLTHDPSPRPSSFARPQDATVPEMPKPLDSGPARTGTARAGEPDAQAPEGRTGSAGTGAIVRTQSEDGRGGPVLPPLSAGLRNNDPGKKPAEKGGPAVPASRLAPNPVPAPVPGYPATPQSKTSGPAHQHLTKAATAALLDVTPDAEIATQRFDLRGGDAVVSRQISQATLLPPDLPRHMAMQLAAAAQSGHPDRPVQVLLNPAELGHVRITLHTGDGMVNVTVIAERPETLDLMRRHIETLAQEFQKIGYHQAEFSFGGGQSAGSGNTASDRRMSQREDGILPGPTAPDAFPTPAAHLISDRLDLRL